MEGMTLKKLEELFDSIPCASDHDLMIFRGETMSVERARMIVNTEKRLNRPR
jgi:hypothetical protein